MQAFDYDTSNLELQKHVYCPHGSQWMQNCLSINLDMNTSAIRDRSNFPYSKTNMLILKIYFRLSKMAHIGS